MFTGIIEGTGVIRDIRRGSRDFSIDVDTGSAIPDPRVGESVALDGVCLTVVSSRGAVLSFDVSPETINRTTLREARRGGELNIERAMRLGDRVGGHLVSGHVDTVGELIRVTPSGAGHEIEVGLPVDGMKYIIEKGSIAIAGISLTVASKNERSITVAVIPHTWEVTTLKNLSTGSTVNIEYDMISKYVENFVKTSGRAGGGVDMDFLSRHGFTKGK